MPFKELLDVFKKNRKLRQLTREHISNNNILKSSKSMIYIPELMYFVMLMHSAVNVHVNTGANENPIKAVREGSIILCFKRARFERATSTSQRRVPKVIEKLSACFQRSQSKNKLL